MFLLKIYSLLFKYYEVNCICLILILFSCVFFSFSIVLRTSKNDDQRGTGNANRKILEMYQRTSGAKYQLLLTDETLHQGEGKFMAMDKFYMIILLLLMLFVVYCLYMNRYYCYVYII